MSRLSSTNNGPHCGFFRPLVAALIGGALVLSASARPPKGAIGSPKPDATVVQKGDTWTIIAGGADIWGQSDQCHFVSYASSGNCTLTAKITAIGEVGAHDWSKAALMIRADDSVGSPHASISVSHCGAVEFLTRNVPGADTRTEKIPNIALPIFVRIARTGNDFAAAYSQDGKTWINVGQPKTVAMKPSALAGMAVTSHADGSPVTAVFSNFVMKR